MTNFWVDQALTPNYRKLSSSWKNFVRISNRYDTIKKRKTFYGSDNLTSSCTEHVVVSYESWPRPSPAKVFEAAEFDIGSAKCWMCHVVELKSLKSHSLLRRKKRYLLPRDRKWDCHPRSLYAQRQLPVRRMRHYSLLLPVLPRGHALFSNKHIKERSLLLSEHFTIKHLRLY